MTDHPITPPPELVKKWADSRLHNSPQDLWCYIATRAAQWGADTELDACCKWLNGGSEIDYDTAALLRAARRPKPLSLVEKALEAWERQMTSYEETDAGMDTIRRALERLQELEGNG